ncbi:MAG TPA: M1 family metallopeptidase [Gemmatimonadaceae bacterium]|nr:M1 family metallopeptidase [Gemmatimonadaceae bacterium]
MFALVVAEGQGQTISQLRDYQRGIDAQHYVFHVSIPDSGNTIGVVGTVYVRRTQAVDTLRLDLDSAMKVRRVQANGADVTFTRDANSVRVALPKWDASCANQRPSTIDRPDPCVAWVSVDASGVPSDGLIITQDDRKRWNYFADHWPNRARHWLPSIDHPSDKATVEWRVNAPSSLRVVANGTLTEESPLPNERGRTLTAWRTNKPIPVYVMVIAVAPMAKVALGESACGLTESGGCVQQDVYEAPELAPTTPPGFAAAGRIMDWLSKYVAPFPYEKLSHLQSSTRFGGMENASAIFYADGGFKRMSHGEGIVAHETAHQWFGDAATPARWADLWLSEGFATYFAALWEREARGAQGFRTAMANIRQAILGADVVRTRPVVDTIETVLLDLLNQNSYQKGGFVLHMLRGQVGDSAWIRGVRTYYNAHKHGNATTDDLRRAMESVSRSDLKWFFDQWLTRPGYAELTTSWTHSAGVVTAEITQAARFGVYRLRVPVEVEDATGAVTRRVIEVPAQANAKIALPGNYSAPPRRVTFDPDGDVLAVITAR